MYALACCVLTLTDMKSERENDLGQYPDEAAQAERHARYGSHPTRVSLDELVAKGRTMVDRVRPIVERTVDRLRRFARK